MAWPDNTTLLDGFNRASLGANYTTGSWYGDSALSIISSTLLGCASSWGGGLYSAATFGPDINLIVDIPAGVGSGEINLFARIADTGDTPTGYKLKFNTYGSLFVYLIRVDAGSETQISTDLAVTAFSNGDRLGFSLIGSTITAWVYHSATWVEVGHVTDTTYNNAGYFGFEIETTSTRLDNLTGGTVGGAVPSVSVSDSITVTDTPTASAVGPINKSESITVTENHVVSMTRQVNKSESITVTENLSAAVQVAEAINVNKSESISVTDTPSLALNALSVNKSESITVSENISAAIAGAAALTVSVSDTITISELPFYGGLIAEPAVSDIVAVTDTPLLVMATEVVSVSDSVTATDTPLVSMATQVVSVSDSVTVNESLDITIITAGEINLSVSENVTATDMPAMAMNAQAVNVSDSVTITESISLAVQAAGLLQTSVSDTVTITESVLISITPHPDLLVDASDSITITESVSVTVLAAGLLQISVTDSIAITDAPDLAMAAALFATVAENIVVTESGLIRIAGSTITTQEGRIYIIYSEDRSCLIPAELRHYDISAELRNYIVPIDSEGG